MWSAGRPRQKVKKISKSSHIKEAPGEKSRPGCSCGSWACFFAGRWNSERAYYFTAQLQPQPESYLP